MDNLNNKGDLSPALLLDSRLKSATISDKPILYDYKIVECGSYIQVYYYHKLRTKNPRNDDKVDLYLKKVYIYVETSNKKSKFKENDLKLYCSSKIEERNIIRSKLQCQRIAKANMEYWETFITVTFEDNVTDIKLANKRFKYFIDKIRRVKKDFRYICVPEFQKRGAVHYHLLTNISINDKLMYEQVDNPKYKHIKYWSEGFTRVDNIKGDSKKIVGYISKYMTKDIDDRLFGKNRFFYSQNCIVPKVSYIDSIDSRDFEILQKKIQDKQLIYQNEYLNTYDDSKVEFLEFSTTQ